MRRAARPASAATWLQSACIDSIVRCLIWAAIEPARAADFGRLLRATCGLLPARIFKFLSNWLAGALAETPSNYVEWLYSLCAARSSGAELNC